MKYLFILLLLFSCTPEENYKPKEPIPICYKIVEFGADARGNYIVVLNGSQLERYKVENFNIYLGLKEICDLKNLIQQPR